LCKRRGDLSGNPGFRHIPVHLTTTNVHESRRRRRRAAVQAAIHNVKPRLSSRPRPGCSRTKTLHTSAHSMPLNSSTCPRPVLFLRVSAPAFYRSQSSSHYGCRRIGNPMPVLATLFRMLASIPLYFAHRVLMKDIRRRREAARASYHKLHPPRSPICAPSERGCTTANMDIPVRYPTLDFFLLVLLIPKHCCSQHTRSTAQKASRI
jgi:hypothetical protein